MSEPRVTVVIPVLNEERRVVACLDALAAQEGAPPFEVLVVDNGSADATVEMVRHHRVGARIAVERARGPYAARNTGIAQARGEIIAFTDADCLADPVWMSEGVRVLDAGADLAGGRVVQMASARPTVWERYDRATYLRQDEFIAREHFAATANLFVRASVFAELGAFVPELTASGDLELGHRATAAGRRLVYAPEARVRHHPRTTLRDTWALHRKLGMGFSELARHGIRGPAWRDPALRISLGSVVEAVAAQGERLRFRELAPVHALVLAARWTGRLTARV